MIVELKGEISPAHPALRGHFPGDPIVPGVVILTEVEHALRDNFGSECEIILLPMVKFLAVLRPKQRFKIELERVDSLNFRFTVRRNETKIAIGLAECRCDTGSL